MQEHLKRLDGVGKVDVSLESGKVAIFPQADAKLDPAGILRAAYDSGVSVAEMTMTASGQLVDDPVKGLSFKVTGDQVFEVKPNPVSEGLKGRVGSGTSVTLTGRLYQKSAGKPKSKKPTPLRLEILYVLNPRGQ